jgi:hypothetical protein
MKKDLNDVASKLNLRLQRINSEIYVYSSTTDEWYIEEFNGKLLLYHKNIRGNRSELRHFHKQKEYRYINYIKVLN